MAKNQDEEKKNEHSQGIDPKPEEDQEMEVNDQAPENRQKEKNDPQAA